MYIIITCKLCHVLFILPLLMYLYTHTLCQTTTPLPQRHRSHVCSISTFQMKRTIRTGKKHQHQQQ